MYQYKMEKLPKAISQLINNSLNTNPAKTLRSSSKSMNIKSKTYPGDITYDLINIWNKTTCKIKERTYSDKTCKDIIKKYLAKENKSDSCDLNCVNCINTETQTRHLKYKLNKKQRIRKKKALQ